MVKMKKPGRKRALAASWEGPYRFIRHADGEGNFDFEDGSRICIVQMQMDNNGRGLVEIFRSISFYKNR